MRPGTSHPEPHRSWIPSPAFAPLGAASRRYWSDSAHQECHFYQYWLQNRNSENHASTAPAAASGPTRSEERVVEEAAMPGQPVRTRARFQFPPAIHPRELPAATSVTAIIILASFENCHVFAEPTLRQNVAPRNRKTFPPCAEAVDDESSLWKPEENRAGIAQR